MKHEVIISRAIAFTDVEVLEGYMAREIDDIPLSDVWMPDVQSIIVGYRKIVLKGEDGRTRFVGDRRQIKGLAVDGKAIPVHGSDFCRMTINGDETERTVTREIVEKKYSVDWFEGVECSHMAYDDYDEAKAFFDATPGAMLTVAETTTRYTITKKDAYNG